MKSRKRKKIAARKAHKKTAEYAEGGGKSRYARKQKFLAARGDWGFNYREPKPWK